MDAILLLIFLEKLFTKAQFDEICNTLSPDNYINPHKSMFGIGNYDVNSIISALESQNKELIWFDKRRDITEESIELTRAFGYIMNVRSDYSFGFITLPLKNIRHWKSLRRLKDDSFYNLDSKLDKPKLIGNNESFVTYLKNEMSSNDKELFIVVPKS
jgi:josephin